MIYGIVRNGVWDYPCTVSEYFVSECYIDIINDYLNDYDFEELYDIFPEEWLDSYQYDVFQNEFANSYESKKEPYKNFKNIQSYISEDFYVKYKPDKFDVTKPYTKNFEDLFKEDFDFILRNNVLYYSKSLGENFWKEIQQFIFDDNIIHISINNQKSKINIKKNAITTSENYYNYNAKLTETYSNFRGNIVKTISSQFKYARLNNIIQSYFNNVVIINDQKDKSQDKNIVYNMNIVPTFSRISPSVKVKANDNIISIIINNCSCPIEYDIIAKLSICIFDKYNKVYEEGDNSSMNRLKYLRSINPRLFVRNYTRECSVLPIYINENIDNNCIEFPQGSGQYYTAPEGYYVGLKENRLDNKSEFPYIIACYKTNHLDNSSRIIYKHINNMQIQPKVVHSLLDIFRDYEEVGSVHMNVMMQELYDVNINTYQIKGIGDEYRYFEELYNINIIIVDKQENVILPKHKEPYFWDYNSSRCTIILKQNKVKSNYSYEKLHRHTERFIVSKLNITNRSTYNPNLNYLSQHIDFNGKVRMLKINDEWIEAIGAPLNVPKEFVLNTHINDIMAISNKFYESLNLNSKEVIYDSRDNNYYIHRYTENDLKELF